MLSICGISFFVKIWVMALNMWPLLNTKYLSERYSRTREISQYTHHGDFSLEEYVLG